jgi:hypothetical protein
VLPDGNEDSDDAWAFGLDDGNSDTAFSHPDLEPERRR